MATLATVSTSGTCSSNVADAGSDERFVVGDQDAYHVDDPSMLVLGRLVRRTRSESALHREECSEVASRKPPAARTNTAKGNWDATPSENVIASAKQLNKVADPTQAFLVLNPRSIARPKAPSMTLSPTARAGITLRGRKAFTRAV